MRQTRSCALLAGWLSLAGLQLGGACGDDDGVEPGDEPDARPAAGSDATPPQAGSSAVDASMEGPLTQPDAAAQSDAGPTPATDAAVPDGGNFRPPPTNVSFETALRVEPSDKTMLQDVRSAEQIDYYLFGGEQGEFFEISTDRSSFSPDVVVTLFDAARIPIAQNDDGRIWPGDGIDARIVVRLPHSGDYFVKVDDPYTPPQFFDSSFPLLYYHLRLRKLTDGVAGVALAHRSATSTVTFAQDARTGYAYATLLGEFGEATGTFEITGTPAQALIGHALGSGMYGNGSTAEGGIMRVLDADQHVLARIDRGTGQSALDPPIGEAAYQLKVFGQGTLGSNPFYAVDFVMLGDNPREANEADNGVLANAEPIELEGMNTRRGLVLVSLPKADVDYFRVEAKEHESISIACEGASGGSGVRGLRAELRDDSDQVLASGIETDVANLQVERTTVLKTGTYYVRLASDTTDEGAASVDPWARCAVIVGL